jgi:hypothetical protein
LSEEPESAGPAFVKGPIPPHAQLFDILTEAELAELVSWTINHEASFKPAKVYLHAGEDGSRIDPGRRTALKLREFGPWRKRLCDRLLAHLPRIMECTGYHGAPPLSVELELNAYGEGGHFEPHIDISTGPGRTPLGAQSGEDRLLSAVYYFYKEPKGFSGGALRLFRFGADAGRADDDDVVSYEPVQNSLVAFPSWALHEVERVGCPSGHFSDFRFALNCWFCRQLSS